MPQEADVSADYESFARAYDRFWGDFSRSRFGPWIFESLRDTVGENARVVDLACGGGQLLAWLATRGFEVAGADASPTLVALARERIGSNEVEVARLEALRLQRNNHDAALCVFDSLNHVAPQDLRAVLDGVAAHLRPGGVFLFDINLEEGFATRWRGMSAEVEDDAVVVARPRWEPDRARGVFAVTVLEAVSDDCWSRTDVELVQYVHDHAIEPALARAGFEILGRLDGGAQPSPLRSPGRRFYLTRRES